MSNTINQLPKNTFKNTSKTVDSEIKVTPEKDAITRAVNNKSARKTKKIKKDSENINEPMPNREKFIQIVGIVSLLLSFYILVVCVSYMINWFTGTADNITNEITANQILLDKSFQSNNIGGRLGAFISNMLVKQGFGIGVFFLIVWLFGVGVHYSLKHKVFPIFSGLGIAILGMVWLSTTLGYILKNTKYSILGGVTGYETSDFLGGFLGEVGLILVLVTVLVIFLIIAYNFSFIKIKNIWKNRGSKATDNEIKISEIIASNEQKDKYNTVEYAVKEEDRPISEKQNKFITTNESPKTDEDDFEFVNKPIEKKTTSITSSNVEFTVENTSALDISSKISGKKENISTPVEVGVTKTEPNRGSIDTPFDPKFELSDFKLPTSDLLKDYGSANIQVNQEELEENKDKIVETLANYGIQIDKIRATVGPTVTLYEIIPAPGVRISRIKNLEDDIALSLAALGIRIIAPIPGKGTIGIEVPNMSPTTVGMRSIVESDKFINNKYDLPIGIGKTISNEEFVVDLAKMPHILMAGATGQGKSVGLNTIITSLLYHKHPSELKFVMVDPKKVELTLFSKIERHYLAKLPSSEEAIITDTQKVVNTLKSLIIEMDSRYDLLQDAQVRNIKEYNEKFISRKLNPNEGHRFLPYIVMVVDEFADLILTAGKEVEFPITRLAQLARAVGMHLVIATQRPSVNIITGTIKANFPARIAFRVISKIDSRTILDTSGADQLIGKGDMLLSQGGDMIRLQCAFIDTPEVERITDFIGSQRGYANAFELPEVQEEDIVTDSNTNTGERDELFEDAARVIVLAQQGSTSLIQRRLKLGYNRAGRIIDQLETAGIVGPFEGSKAREVKIANEFALEQFLKDLYAKDN